MGHTERGDQRRKTRLRCGSLLIGASPAPSLLAADFLGQVVSGAPLAILHNAIEALRGDPAIQDAYAFDEMQRLPMLMHAIGESCRIKAEIVAVDEREAGERALLNFGHTFGHAIEAAMGYGEWLHGEAVAAGMVIAARLSQRVTGLTPGDTARLSRLLERAQLPVRPPAIAFDRWQELIQRDKKAAGGSARFVLLDAIGRATVHSGIADADVRAALEW